MQDLSLLFRTLCCRLAFNIVAFFSFSFAVVFVVVVAVVAADTVSFCINMRKIEYAVYRKQASCERYIRGGGFLDYQDLFVSIHLCVNLRAMYYTRLSVAFRLVHSTEQRHAR